MLKRRSAVFTIVSANYIGFAATLMQSVRQYHPEVSRFIVLSDAFQTFPDVDVAAELLPCDEIGIRLIENMKLWYTVIEFNTAVKPFTFKYLFKAFGFDNVLYIDPDISLFSRLTEVYTALRGHNIVLTPHMICPLQDGKSPSDLTIMKSGVYNLGFLGARNDLDTASLIDWWCDRLFRHCRVDIPEHMFTDQRWMDLAPVFVPKPYILRHPGYNVAYWNLAHRTMAQDRRGRWSVNGHPLRFFHFSGIKPNDDVMFSKHQDRFTYGNLGQVAELCRDYRAAVLTNRWEQYSKVPYAFGAFRDGQPISDHARRWIMRAIDNGQLDDDQPLEIDSGFFDRPEERSFPDGGRLTRFSYQFWLDRRDLQSAFDLDTTHGFAGYVEWFSGGSGEREGVDPLRVRAALELRDGACTPDRHLAPALREPPWPPVTTSAWNGPAADVERWLKGTICFELEGQAVSIPMQAALVWERRTDLQAAFEISTREELERYLAWVMTEASVEQSVDLRLLDGATVSELATVSDISHYYGDVPITRGMILVRGAERGRTGFNGWRRFPLEKQARIEQGFWFAYVAPRLFGWPDEMSKDVKAFFDAPTRVRVGPYYFFSRGMLSLWEIRPDLQRVFSLSSEQSKMDYLRWLIFCSREDVEVEPHEFCPGLQSFLATPSGWGEGISWLLALVYMERADLQDLYDMETGQGRTGLIEWASWHLADFLHDRGVASLVLSGSTETPPLTRHVAEATVALAGHWTTPSGIGEDLRTSIAAFDAVGFKDYIIIDFDELAAFDSDKNPLPHGAEISVEWNIVHHNADTALEDWKILKKLSFHAVCSIGHWAWELERLPSYWRHSFSFYDEIWAATRFAERAFAAEKLRPVRLVRNPVEAPRVSGSYSRNLLGLSPTATVFLFMFDFNSFAVRKNPQAVLGAFEAAFADKTEDVQLIIKTQNATRAPELWRELLSMSKDERIIWKDARMPRAEVIALLQAADVFVSLHRSEGFGRGPAEAMLLGRTVIMTGYSGSSDYADETTACLVDYRLVPVEPGQYPGVEGQSWAEADVEDAARWMRWAHTDPDQAKAMGARARQRILSSYSPKKIGQEMLTALGLIPTPQIDMVA